MQFLSHVYFVSNLSVTTLIKTLQLFFWYCLTLISMFSLHANWILNCIIVYLFNFHYQQMLCYIHFFSRYEGLLALTKIELYRWTSAKIFDISKHLSLWITLKSCFWKENTRLHNQGTTRCDFCGFSLLLSSVEPFVSHKATS